MTSNFQKKILSDFVNFINFEIGLGFFFQGFYKILLVTSEPPTCLTSSTFSKSTHFNKSKNGLKIFFKKIRYNQNIYSVNNRIRVSINFKCIFNVFPHDFYSFMSILTFRFWNCAACRIYDLLMFHITSLILYFVLYRNIFLMQITSTCILYGTSFIFPCLRLNK